MAKEESVVVLPLRIERADVPIVGVTELISHAWSDKAKRMMLDKQMGNPVQKKVGKDPEADYEAAFYRLADGRPGMPASAFKAAIVGACRLFKGLPMTQIKTAIRVDGDLIPIEGEPRMREDMVRLATGVADIRYRPGFPQWRAVLPITYVSSIVTLDQVINLVDAAGLGGVGEWRPSAPRSFSGTFGCFRVEGKDGL
jgi:hypothetical protein